MLVNVFALLLSGVCAAAGVTPVVAEVNGDVILARDLEALVTPAFKQLEERYEGEELKTTKVEYFNRSLEGLIEQKLLVQKAEELGMTIADEDIEEEMDRLAARVGGWAALLDLLARMGVSYEEKVQNIREQAMARRLLSEIVLPKIYTSPADARRYYDEHKDEFVRPMTYGICQIIVWKSRYPSDKEARTKLAEIEKKLADGEDFSDVARQISDGPHAKEGGDWGYVVPEDLLEELAEALGDMKTGDVRGPVETRVGYHILKLTGMKDPSVKPYDEAHEEIEQLIRNRIYTLESKKVVEDLRRIGEVKIYDEAVSDLCAKLTK